MKKKVTIPLIMVMFASLFSGFRARAATPEQAFWAWFQNNDAALFDFEKDQEKIFDRLNREMNKVNPTLTFEFGPKQNGRRDFVISADGIKAAFPAVEALYAAAPTLPHWKIIKFRPRRKPMDIEYQGVSVKASTVRVHLEVNGGMAGLTVYIPGYSPDNKAFLAINYLLLDQALGEYDVETYVGEIRVEASPYPGEETLSLEELPAALDSSVKRSRVQ